MAKISLFLSKEDTHNIDKMCRRFALAGVVVKICATVPGCTAQTEFPGWQARISEHISRGHARLDLFRWFPEHCEIELVVIYLTIDHLTPGQWEGDLTAFPTTWQQGPFRMGAAHGRYPHQEGAVWSGRGSVWNQDLSAFAEGHCAHRAEAQNPTSRCNPQNIFQRNPCSRRAKDDIWSGLHFAWAIEVHLNGLCFETRTEDTAEIASLTARVANGRWHVHEAFGVPICSTVIVHPEPEEGEDEEASTSQCSQRSGLLPELTLFKLQAILTGCYCPGSGLVSPSAV
ncbi:hypothetical protein B0H13DRAFT_1850535 [Mycena leptocephala]|nr:hypothetical protein B0H13DRAFT_1850535 [Mycena leptocephala]